MSEKYTIFNFHNSTNEMQKIVFENPDCKPKPELAKRYTEIIGSSLSKLKCPLHNQLAEFELIFYEPNIYLIRVSACCAEFKSTVENRISLMLS